ncbi:MAG: multifunctional CCA addition/repair protein [Legionella sp.]|nr:MAG: multifunctional CCA addition/repair protein [Legionella sp.]PJE00033.1 MAG: multifunctional CCA addition/repair protein [Legionella sp.]
MKVYLVGGAVRDHLLGLPVRERDWVVVGGSPEALLQKKYRQVGRDFPVFLHPETQEEYALARMERKAAPGYYGFICDFNPNVTLAEDLLRRDLTINAMAMDEQGQIIDPYHGQEDLRNKWLRHVSWAFTEDPVRVLRVARFAARFYSLGFRVANETRLLMYQMVQNKELEALVAERVWQEWQRSLCEPHPEQFLLVLRACGALRVILPELDALFGVPIASLSSLPVEKDSGLRALLVLQRAAQLSPDPVIRFAALLQDLGNAQAPISSWPLSFTDSKQSVSLIQALGERLRVPKEYTTLAVLAARYHRVLNQIKEQDALSLVTVLEGLDAFRRPHLLSQLLLVCQAGFTVRQPEEPYPQAALWTTLLAECAKVAVDDIIADGHQGQAIKQELHQRRLARIESLITLWKTE